MWAATVESQRTPNRVFAYGLIRRLLRLGAFLEVSIFAKVPPEASHFVAGDTMANAALKISEARHCQNMIVFHPSIVVDAVLLLCKVDGEDDGVVSRLYEHVVLNAWN